MGFGRQAPLALLALLFSCASEEFSSPRSRGTGASSSSGGAGSSSGTNDAGPAQASDAASDASSTSDAATADPCAGRAICDSFESRAPGDAPGGPWKVEVNGAGTVAVSDVRAYGPGKRSVKVTTPSAQYQRAMFVAAGAPLFTAQTTASATLFGRMMVWLENSAADGVHWTMISGEGPVPNKTGVRAFNRYGGQHQGKLMANYDTQGASSDCWQHSATVMPTGKWVCVTWKLSSPTNEMRFAMDGKDIADLTVGTQGQGCIGHDLGDVWYPGTFDRAVLGWESYQTDAGHTMYIDEVILDDAPVACP